MNIPLIGALLEQVISYFTTSKETKAKLKEIKEQAKIDKAKRDDEFKQIKHESDVEKVTRRDTAETNYDLVAQQNARESIIDELMIAWVLGIVTMIFVPEYQPYIINGFKALQEYVPYWFQLVFCGAFISKLGLRFLFSKGAIDSIKK